ncbi:MAG TPA: penicillin-binding protein 2 [Candidatus Cybelea sp.]|jgi:penicillin-binding protein 2|nr:penicillin-binding protein 2 [Candidatus Cybelea sp.]
MMPSRGVPKPAWRRPTWRLVAFGAVVALSLCALLGRLVQVQVLDGARYRAAAQANQIRLIPVAAPRGMIFDRHGRIMARSSPSFVVAMIPSQVRDVHRELASVAQITGTGDAELADRMLHHRGVNYPTFAALEADEPYGPVVLATGLPVAAVARLSEVLNDLPGIDLEVQPIRDYPNGPFGSHLIGYVGAITEDEYARLRNQGYSPNDVIGKDGLEYSYDKYLRGTPGGQRVVVDATGAVVSNAKLALKPPVPGDALITNVDWHLQQIVEAALAKGVRAVSGGRTLSGAVVAEDPWTGGILALASYPNYNPNDFAANRWKRVVYDLTNPSQPLFDRAIAAATPTGSTFKMVTGSAALTEGVVKVDQIIDDTGGWDCGGYYARDIAAGGLGDTTFVPALAASSDGYFFRLAWWLGNERLRKYALAFGLDARSGVDLPGENEGNWPTNAWEMRAFGVPMEPSDACFLGIGQGAMQATPLQIVNVASAVINGGTLYRPEVVHEIRDAKGDLVTRFDPLVIRQVPVKQTALAAVREGMARVTDPGGTAYGLAIDGLPYSGKTGTVETAGGNGPNTTWFVAWAPTNHPRLALAVFVDRSGGYGATVAAPIAREILVKYFNKKP